MDFTHNLFTILALLASCALNAYATPPGVGFGWDSNVNQETVYQVDLGSGDVQVSGLIPTLKYVTVGAHHIDYASSSAMLLGSTSAEFLNTLFVVIPSSQTIYSFSLSSFSERSSINGAFLRSSDGAIFLSVSNPSEPGIFSIYQAALNATTGTSTITKIGAVVIGGVGLDSTKISDNGKIYFLTAESTPHLIAFDTTTGLSETTILTSFDTSALFVCDSDSNSDPRIFALGSEPNDRTSQTKKLKEITVQGFGNTLATTSIIDSFIAGSTSCKNNTLRLLSGSGSPGAVFSFNINSTTDFTVTPLSTGNLKIVSETKSAIIANAATNRGRAAAQVTSKYKIIPSNTLKKCSKQRDSKNSLKKARALSLRSMAQRLKKVRVLGGKCIFKL